MSSGEGGFLKWAGGIVASVIAGVTVYNLTTEPDPAPSPAPAPVVTPAQASTVDFVVSDELGVGQISERISVTIDGRSVGTLTVDMVHPSGEIVVTVPRGGAHRYELTGTMAVQDGSGEPITRGAYGTGIVSVSAGRRFSLVGDFTADPVLVALQ